MVKPRARPWRKLGLAAAIASLVASSTLILAVQPWVTPIPSRPVTIDEANLERDIRALSESFHPRSYDDVENLEATAGYIAEQLVTAGGRVTSQPVVFEGLHYRNVVARFGPETGPIMVVGAHYDACRTSDEPNGVTPGADDNASGVAALLELARLMGREPPTRAVELVAYVLEEPPFFATPNMGSAWHARELVAQGRTVDLMLSLESIGYFSDSPSSQRYPLPGMSRLYGTRGNFVALVGEFGRFGSMRHAKALASGASALPVRSFNAPAWVSGIGFSDHRNYWAEGLPAIMVTDTAFLRNPHYHQATDTLDHIDLSGLAQVVQGVHAIVRMY